MTIKMGAKRQGIICQLLGLLMILGSLSSLADSVLPPVVAEGEHISNYPGFPDNMLDALQNFIISGPAVFSPDGQLMAAFASDKSVKIWDVESRNLLHNFNDYEEYISSVVFSPGGNYIAIGYMDGIVKFWDIKTHKLLSQFDGETEHAKSISFNYDGSLMAVSLHYSTVKIWDIKTGQIKDEFDGYTDAVFSLKDDTLILKGHNKIDLWDSQHSLLIQRINGDRQSNFSLSTDGTTLAIVSTFNNKIDLWNIKKRSLLRTINRPLDYNSFSVFTPDNQSLAINFGDRIEFWNINRPTLSYSFKIPKNYYSSSMTFSRDNKILALTNHGAIELWNIKSHSLLHSFRGHSMLLGESIISPAGDTLASIDTRGGDNSRAIKLWDIHNHRLLRSFDVSVNSNVAYSSDGSLLAAASMGGSVNIWDMNSLRLLHRFKYSNDRHVPRSVVTFSPDGHMLAVAMTYEGKLNLWDIRTGNLIYRIDSCSITSMTFSPDGKELAGACWDEPIKFWDVKTGKFLRNLGEAGTEFTHVAFSPDGKTLAGAISFQSDLNSHIVKLWDIETHQLLHSFKGGYSPQNSEDSCLIFTFFSMTFTPNGNLFISNNHMLNMWNTKTGNLVHSIDADSYGIYSLSFVSGSNLLAVGFYDKVELWDVLGAEPYMRLFHGQRGNWLMWDNQGDFWRGDDGTLLLNKDFSSVLAH